VSKTRTAAPASAFGQSTEDFSHATRRGFEAVQDRTIADAEFGLAGLALEIPDVFLAAVATAADEGVDLVIGDAVVQAVGVWAGVSSRHDPFLAAARVLDL
jgi:hypothetical protein